MNNTSIVKSVNPQIKDEEVINKSASVGFCSFSRLVEDYLNKDPNYKNKINGFRVTNQGIEILFKNL